ncbi:MAG: hypothetical protein EB069_00870 [Actinobacteria bacterium]|nr:hypothetical protein [Actinomycetota bacterium]
MGVARGPTGQRLAFFGKGLFKGNASRFGGSNTTQFGRLLAAAIVVAGCRVMGLSARALIVGVLTP